MKKKTVEKIEKQIIETKKLPKEIKENIKNEIFKNITISIVIIMYFIFLILGSLEKSKTDRMLDFQIFSMLGLVISIVLFEIAYKKNKGIIAIYGIESLIVAIITLFTPYVIFELNKQEKPCFIMVGAYIGIYYLVKCIYIYIHERKKYNNSTSDIKELVKKESKDKKAKEAKEKLVKKENKNEKAKKTKTTKGDSETPRKRGRPRKKI